MLRASDGGDQREILLGDPGRAIQVEATYLNRLGILVLAPTDNLNPVPRTPGPATPSGRPFASSLHSPSGSYEQSYRVESWSARIHRKKVA